jgi:4-hydroxy-3-polyprenylbenzoate decarboxylase
MDPIRIIVAITGASGAIYGIRMLEALQTLNIESHLIISKSAHLTIATETTLTLSELQQLASFNYAPSDIAASLASGSFKTAGMIIAPCSAKTMMRIAGGGGDGLIARAADVVLKERRKLVLMIRETPLHLGHLRAMVTLSEMGVIIAPPVPAFYNMPTSIDEIVEHSIGRVLDLFELNSKAVKRWEGMF